MLLNNMKYFEQYLKKDQAADTLDISVHCDVKIFEWLVKYVDFMQNYNEFNTLTAMYKINYQVIDEGKPVNQQVNVKPPHLDIRNCISIIISAEFLKMA